MICRQCGTEIADKAIVCYRCGAATTDPVYKPASVARGRSRRGGVVATVLALVLLVLLALYMGRLSNAGVPPMLTYVVVAVAVVIVGLRAYARR
jgi:uncharacterized membrane-anchored protein